MKKRPLVAGNWKMELSHKSAIEVMRAIKKLLSTMTVECDIVVCPSYPSLEAISAMTKKGFPLAVGAQTIHAAERGAYTGEVSAVQIRPFVEWCIVGHSEVRSMRGETEEQINQSAELLLRHGIIPIVCIGETGEEREHDQTVEKITTQINILLNHLDRTSLTKTVLAYEPIWAIGTGVTPDPDQVAEVVLLIRKLTADRFAQDVADRLRILYGGSVTPENVSQYVGGPVADGVLVGGASTHPRSFVDIIKKVQETFR